MKKFEYSPEYSEPVDRVHELENIKHEDYDLPNFSKEIPVSSKKSESGKSMILNYSWNETKSNSIKVRTITFRKTENLENFYKVNARDGLDSLSVKHMGSVYILRKTTKEVANALYNMGNKLMDVLEGIVGYFKTVLGNIYIISKLDGKVWSFDKRITRTGAEYLDTDFLAEQNKRKLFDLVVDRLSTIHMKNLVIGKFSINNILLYEDSMKFGDLRELRISRKRSVFVEEFMNVMRYLFAIGIASRADMYCAAAAYATVNDRNCRQWYKEKTGSVPGDELDVVCSIEKHICD